LLFSPPRGTLNALLLPVLAIFAPAFGILHRGPGGD
jgi:hypothetical protein